MKLNFSIVLFSTILLLGTILHGQSFEQIGLASFYADKFEGRTTANGEIYKHSKFTAAHKSLPFGTMLMVTNLQNGKIVTVRVNDRGPFVQGRIIDLSKLAAKELDFVKLGITKVKITAVNDRNEGKKVDGASRKLNKQLSVAISGYYDISGKNIKIKGFGVQIASFKEMNNLLELIEDLHKIYNDRIFIQVSVIQNVKHYKISIGGLKTNEKAEKLKGKLKVAYPDCYVIKY